MDKNNLPPLARNIVIALQSLPPSAQQSGVSLQELEARLGLRSTLKNQEPLLAALEQLKLCGALPELHVLQKDGQIKIVCRHVHKAHHSLE